MKLHGLRDKLINHFDATLSHDSNPSPPHNPALKPEVVDTNDRGFFEEDDFAQRVWSVFDKGVDGGASSATQGVARPQQEYRPPMMTTSTTRRPSVNMNSIDFNGAAPELEIEYPPESNDSKNGNEVYC